MITRAQYYVAKKQAKKKNKGLYITAILPAHNEAKSIKDAIVSIRDQVDNIIVACDNCTDDTYKIAKNSGADDVFKTHNNHHRKAGALNQALEHHVHWHILHQYILIMDADTVIRPNWMKTARKLIYPNRKKGDKYTYDAVGSVFYANLPKHPTVLQLCQYNEWVRYSNKIYRDHKVFVLTGTCSLINAQKLLDVKYKYHRFYDEQAITEDFAMTIDLKSVGTKMISPLSCKCLTETMSSYKGLLTQRRRWYDGAISLIMSRRWNRVLWPYIWQQIMLFISVFAFMLFIAVSIYTYVTRSVGFTWFWTIVFIVFDIERVATVWNTNVKDRWFAAVMMPELWYAFILQIAYIMAVFTFVSKSKLYWNREVNKKLRKKK